MLIINATVHTMDSSIGTIENGYIKVVDSKISAVGEMQECPQADVFEEVVDAAGRMVLPGFVDAHSHIGLLEDGIGSEGDDLNEMVDPCTPHLRTLDAINPQDRCFIEARQAGITCVVVSPGSANPVAGQICALKTVGRSVDEMTIAQPLAIKLAMGENPKRIYGRSGKTPQTRMATAAIIREQLFKASRYMDKLDNARKNGTALPEFNMRCEALVPLLRREIRAHFHAHKANDILSAMRIAKEFNLEFTIVHCTDGHKISDILAENHVDAVCGPLICARTKPELAGLEVDNCAALVKAGVNVAITTDHPEVPAQFLASSAALAVSGGMDRTDALKAITINAARAAALDSRVGSISVGKDADLLVFSSDPLSIGVKPEIVVINGEIAN